jgi:L-asparaginase II
LSEVLVEVLRGSRIESIHRGSIAVVNAAGEIIYQAGDPAFEISMRSCAKPLQALPVIVSGAAERFKFTEQELAIVRHAKRRTIAGAPEQVRDRLLALAGAYGAAELVIVTITYDFKARLRSYQLLAEAFGLDPSTGRPGGD